MNTLWVFQSKKSLKTIAPSILEKINLFFTSWNAHGVAIKALVNIEYEHFIIIRIPQNPEIISGCAIDALHRMIQGLEQEFSLTLRDPMTIAIKKEKEIYFLSFQEFKNQLKLGNLTKDTLFFNNAISKNEDYPHNWLTNIQNSWAKNFSTL